MKSIKKIWNAMFGYAAIAINAVMTPLESDNGTESLDADAGAIAFKNALVKKGSDDRHFAVVTAQADIPFGILLNDEVVSGEEGVIKKSIAILGVWDETLPCVSDGSSAINPGDEIVASVATPGNVRKRPATSGQTYLVIGRSRFSVAANAGDPVSLMHKVPGLVTNP